MKPFDQDAAPGTGDGEVLADEKVIDDPDNPSTNNPQLLKFDAEHNDPSTLAVQKISSTSRPRRMNKSLKRKQIE